MIDPAAQARLERWKRSLLDLTAANRLLDARDGTTMIALSSVDPVRLAAALTDGASFTLASAPAGAPDGEAVMAGRGADPIGARQLGSALGERELARRIVAIRRAARAHMDDGGVHTLWLGLGMLTWRAAEDDAVAGDAAAGDTAPAGRGLHVDPLHGDRQVVQDREQLRRVDGDLARDPAAGDAAANAAANETVAGDVAVSETAAGAPVLRRAPVVLWPVSLVRSDGGGLALVEAPGVEPRFNLTLGEKLRRDFGISLGSSVADGGAVRGIAGSEGGTERAARLESDVGAACSAPANRSEQRAEAGAQAEGYAPVDRGSRAKRAAQGERAGQASERGGQLSERGGQRSERGGQLSERGGQASERGGQRSEGSAPVGGVTAEPGPGAELDVAGLLDAAEAIAASRPGWRLERSAQLGIFSLARIAMWSDLDARGDELLQSPIVAHLARGAGVAFGQPSHAAAVAVGASPGSVDAADVLAPLDADASQLAAVAAAGAGASFVLQGPPGTGKSQTIANVIAHCVTHGKTVLFVADKIAALEVVQQRLAAVGLGEFCLELHSHKAVRAQVVAQLGR
ncbi:MAG TPA: DUF4011 domain-containing protein, partial [Kofleriaceae bacterium]